MERVNVGLVGFGTVGSAFFQLMRSNGELFARKFGVAAQISAVAEKNEAKVTGPFPEVRVTGDYRELVADPEIPVLVELVGGTGVAARSSAAPWRPASM